MVITSLTLILALLCWVAVAGAAEAQQDSLRAVTGPRALVMSMVDAYGGRPALEQVKGYRMDGAIVAAQPGKAGPMTRSFQRPGKLRVELRYPEQSETRIVSGSQDNSVMVWDAATGKKICTLKGHGTPDSKSGTSPGTKP